MALIICPECGREFSDKAASCPQCACPIEYIKGLSKEEYDKQDLKIAKSSDTAASNAQKTLPEYLNAVLDLELEIYILNRTISTLPQLTIKAPKRKIYGDPPLPLKTADFDRICFKNENEMIKTIDFYERKAAYYGIADKYYFDIMRKYPGGAAPDMAELSQELYEIEVPAYQKAQQKADKEYQEALSAIKACYSFFDKQVSALRNERTEAENNLQALYGLDIIYPKYRGLVPVATFCEYAASGRCNTLEGPDGMYNLYERELLAHFIVNNLTEINESISRIDSRLGDISQQLTSAQRNQELLYLQIIKGNTLSNAINENIVGLIDHVSSLDHKAGNISAALNRMQEANKINAVCEDFAHARLAHMDKMQTYSFKQMYPNARI